jgi:hypothetical protein
MRVYHALNPAAGSSRKDWNYTAEQNSITSHVING